MKTEKRNGVILFTIIIMLAGILLNILGKWFAVKYKLPFWMDAVGTGVTACLLGPVYGALCGGMNNLLYGLVNQTSYAYGLTSIAIGFVMGICSRKGMLEHKFTAMTASVMVALTAVVISTPLNLIMGGGAIGNVWGDGLYEMLTLMGLHSIIASTLGELFIDFPDKVVMVLLTYLIIRLPIFREWNQEHEAKQIQKKGSGQGMWFLLVLLSVLLASQNPWCATEVAEAADVTGEAGVASRDGTSQEDLEEHYTQTIYNSDNGLSAGEANTIVETPDGYIWIGTYAGIYRYDGHNFTMMNFDSVKNVNHLYVDQKGRLWIGTNDNGISIYENGEIVTVLDKKNGLPSNSIRCIAEDPEGNYYVGTSASLCILSEKDGLKVEKTFEDVTYGNHISASEDGIIAVITNAGELVMLKDQQIKGKFVLDQEGIYYTSCIFLKDGSLRLTTSGSEIYQWNFERNSPDIEHVIRTENVSYIHSVYEDEDKVLWVCTDSGIGYIRDTVFHKVDTGEFNASIDVMIKDYQDNLWFTSSRLGVLKLAHNSFYDLYDQYGITRKVVNSITKWEGMLYSGTDTGLDIMDPETEEPVSNALTEKLTDNRIRCLMVDSKNHLWIATSGDAGLLEVEADGTTHSYGPDQGTVGARFRSTMEFSDGTIVVAENTGIDFIREGKVVKTLSVSDGLTNPQILSLLEKDSDTLWAGSDGDGIMVIQNGAVVDKITEEDGLPSGVILRMVKIEEGVMIVTSNSLCYLDDKNKITELKEFPYSNNYDVVDAGDGNLWVLGSAGIYIVKKEALLKGEELTTELLDSRKGLKSSLTANSWNYQDGTTLYLSSSMGAYRIDTNNYTVYTGSYRVMVDYVDGENVSCAMKENGVNELPNDMSRIRIRPELLNYSLNDPYISYYLEGFDDEATVVQQSELTDVTYTNLPAGTYVFHVSILDNTGSKVLEKHLYTIQKQPRFWEHDWFMAYLVLVCVLGIMYITWFLAVRHTNKIIERQRHEIELARKQAEMGNETILAIAKTVDVKDENTSQHSARVAEYSVMIAKRLGWSEAECENLRQIALLHDIGKIGIPDSILNKPARLTDEEYEVMKSHVVIGSKILKDFTLVKNLADGVRYHHERYDGKGYVEGLKGKDIPLDARIIGIADAFDAMTSNRVYRDHLDLDYVINELKRCSGTQFDPQLVEIFLGLVEDGSIQAEHQSKPKDE